MSAITSKERRAYLSLADRLFLPVRSLPHVPIDAHSGRHDSPADTPLLRPITSALANPTITPLDSVRVDGTMVDLRWYLVFKRMFDITTAVIAVITLSPLFFIIAILIKLTSPGPVFFTQQRCGQDGRMFQCHKFRTMVPDAIGLLERDPELKMVYTEQWKLSRDPRITTVGRVLRKTSLDELPQLWNVIKGDMSIVGPRPVQPDEMRMHYGRNAAEVTVARPGMTGLWQISGRSTLPYEQRVAIDLDYVRRRSMVFDLLIILRTVPALLTARGAE